MNRNIKNIEDVKLLSIQLNVDLIEKAKENVKKIKEHINIFGLTSKEFMVIDYSKIDIPSYGSFLHLDRCMTITNENLFLEHFSLEKETQTKIRFVIDDIENDNSVIEFEMEQVNTKLLKKDLVSINNTTLKFKVYIEYYRDLFENLFLYQLKKLLVSYGATFEDDYIFVIE